MSDGLGVAESPTITRSHESTETLFPTETEIYILPDGRVVVADLPAELGDLVERVGASLEDVATVESTDEYST